MKTIQPAELAKLLASGQSIELIDVRTPVEYAQIHVDGARSMPLDQLDPQALKDGDPGRTIYTICKAGKRGEAACGKLSAAGFTNLINVEGGTDAAAAAGVPVVRNRKVMSLERQVRIAAGSLVLIGTVLSATVHPGFIWLSGFVGAGLIFAGVTDTCGMGMMLAKMPWNRQ